MNFFHIQLSKFYKILICTCFMTSILNCGGGGGQQTSATKANVTVVADTPPAAPEPKDYSPDPDKLADSAESSADLFVEPSFGFDSYRKVTFDISVTDEQNRAMANLMLAISLIDGEVTEYDDPRLQQKSLLSMARTNANGRVYLNLELPLSATKVLLELNAMGIENDVIKTIDEQGIVLYHFKQSI